LDRGSTIVVNNAQDFAIALITLGNISLSRDRFGYVTCFVKVTSFDGQLPMLAAFHFIYHL